MFKPRLAHHLVAIISQWCFCHQKFKNKQVLSLKSETSAYSYDIKSIKLCAAKSTWFTGQLAPHPSLEWGGYKPLLACIQRSKQAPAIFLESTIENRLDSCCVRQDRELTRSIEKRQADESHVVRHLCLWNQRPLSRWKHWPPHLLDRSYPEADVESKKRLSSLQHNLLVRSNWCSKIITFEQFEWRIPNQPVHWKQKIDQESAHHYVPS